MAEASKVELTRSKLELWGVQVTFTVRIGDYMRRVDISPLDYEVFKRWHEIYADKVVKSIVDNIEYELKATNELTKGDE